MPRVSTINPYSLDGLNLLWTCGGEGQPEYLNSYFNSAFGKGLQSGGNPAQEACLNVYNMPICVEHVKSLMVSYGREAMLEICGRHGNLSA